MKCPKKIVKILLPMFRQGCLVFTGRGSRCGREGRLGCRLQTEEESAFFTQRFYIDRDIFSRGKGTLSSPGKQEGWGGSDPAAVAGLDHLHEVPSHRTTRSQSV